MEVEVSSLGANIAQGIANIHLVPLKLQNHTPEGFVRVRIHAAAVNYPDLLMTCGQYQHKPTPPYCPGTEAAGVVIAVGAGVEGFRVGQHVMCGVRDGAMAAVLCVPALCCDPIPMGLDWGQAAAFRVAYSTAYHCLVERAGLKPRDTVLINGATGGVGMAAVQVARAIGCSTVIATGSGAEKLAQVRAAGASAVIDLSSHPLSELANAVKKCTDANGVDVVFDPIGGQVFEQSLRATAWGARVAIVGFASGERPVIRANYALIKGLTIMGCRAGESARREPSIYRPRMEQLARWIELNLLKPHISHVFDVTQVQEAFRVVSERNVVGKCVIKFNGTLSAL